MILDEFFKPNSTANLAEGLGDLRPTLGNKRDQGKSVRKWRKARGLGEQDMDNDNLQGGRSDDEVKFFIDSEPAYYAVMDRFGDHIEFRGDDLVAPLRLWGAIQQTAGDAGGAADIAGLEDEPMWVGDELDEQGMAEGPTDDPRFQKMMGNIQKSTPALVSGYVALNFASEQRSKKIKGVSQNGKPMPDVIDNPEEFLSGKIEFTPDQVEKQLTAIGKKYGWDSIDSGQGQGYTEMFFDTSKEYTSNNQNLLAANIANTVGAINKFFNGMNNSLQATGLPGYKTDVWQGMGPPNDTNQIGDLSQIANIAKGKSAKSDPGTAIGKMILKYIPSYEAENDELGYDPEDFASAMAIAKVYIAQGEKAGLQAQLKAQGHVGDMIDELLSDAGGSGLRTIWDLEEQDMAEGTVIDINNKYRGLARKMVQIYKTVPEVKAAVDDSPEFYRAMVYVTGVITNPEEIDGTPQYDKIVDELESILSSDGEHGLAEGKLKINYDSWLSKVPNTINDKMKKVLRVMQDGKVRSRADMLRAAGIDPNPRSPGGVAGMEGTDYYLYKKGLLDVVDIVKGQKYFKISKNASQGVLETNVAKYKDLGATNQTTHFIKNVTTGKIVSPHRSLQDAEDSLVGNMRDSNDKFKIVRARKGVAEGSKHNQQDLDDVADWMNTTPDKLSVEVKQEPIEKFIKQIREMYGTYDEFPEDEDRTNRILKLLKRGAKPLPIYVEAGDPHLFVMEGRHRMVAFWLAEMKTIPVAYVSINSQQGVAEGSAADGSVNYTLGHTPDAEYVYSIYRDGKKEGTYHSVDQAREIMGNMKRTSPNREYKIKRGARNKMAGPASQLPEQGIAEAHNFKGSFPFDVDHMGGTRGINLPSAPTKKFFTDKKQWSQTVDDINSSKYDDNSEYSGTTGRTTVSIDNREWARWSDAQEKGYIEMSSMTEQDISEAHGNYAGDRPVNLGGVSMKKIQIGDTVRYIDQKAQVVDMSRDREHARITIPSSATTKTVLTSDLRPLGRGVSEETLSELSPATLARYKTKAGAAATAADSAGDRRTGDRRFSGIVKATKKQFDQDAKQSAQAVHESRLRLMASIIKTQ